MEIIVNFKTTFISRYFQRTSDLVTGRSYMQEGEKNVTNSPVFNSDFLKNRYDHRITIYFISLHVKSLYFSRDIIEHEMTCI